ncbi:hypothetical protein [Streptomyces griseorubiginosus]|uniref:hypothetical protein n=1 Tax=Streptomyces griseorubiginosus TaxID=67304 RepID=UPI0036EDE975
MANRVTASTVAAQSTASAPVSAVQVRTGESAADLTSTDVCSLPLDVLLPMVNARLDSTEISGDGFFGYVTITRAGRLTIYTPDYLDDDGRDAAIRFLITKHLGLSSHLFPEMLQATVFDLGSEAQA